MNKYPQIESILYVEDERQIQEELAEVIENFCHTLYLADDGFQGLELYKRHNPEIIISDIKMPIMDGLEMSKGIRKFNSDAHIIFTTAFSDVDFFQEAIELQVDGYILKPIDLELLEKRLIALIRQIELKKELRHKELMLIQQSKLASMGEMIGNIAHQWKQPLSIISMYANHMHVDCELDDMNKEHFIEYSEEITKQVHYLAKTTDDFRSFFKPGVGETKFNIKKFIDKCIDLVKASFDSHTIHTIEDIDEKINSFGDPNQLSQALINILNNAKDALNEAKDLRKKLVFILSAKEDQEKHITITIKDNAGGIPENILPKVFDPYFTTKSSSLGTGLGLYITHSIITDNLHGTIKVENDVFEYEGETYKGAKFTIVLPIN